MIRGFKLGLLLGTALVTVSVHGGTIVSIQSGVAAYDVTGGNCPTGAVGCTPGNAFSSSAAVVPIDSALVVPIPGLGAWNTTSQYVGDASAWIVPAVRVDGTVKFPVSGALGGPMDFGVYIYQFTTHFTLGAGEGATAALYGWWWADGNLETGCGVRLNGNCVSLSLGGPEPDAYGSAVGHLFSLASGSGFVDGTNDLTFMVDNHWRETGLRADVVLDPLGFPIPEPSSLSLLGIGVALASVYRLRK